MERPRTANLGTLRPPHNPQALPETLVLRGKRSAAGRRCRRGEGRSGRRRRALRRLWRFRFQHFLPGSFGWRIRRLELGDHRIGIDRRRAWRGEISGDTDHLHRNGHRLELVQRVGDREAAIRRGHGDRAGRLARRPKRGDGIGAWRRRLELDLYGWRRRFEGVQRERGAARHTIPCNRNRDA